MFGTNLTKTLVFWWGVETLWLRRFDLVSAYKIRPALAKNSNSDIYFKYVSD